jgi:hypothetical protein
MAQIYYFCFNYLGVSFFSTAFADRKKSVCGQSLFSAFTQAIEEKELQQSPSTSRRPRLIFIHL